VAVTVENLETLNRHRILLPNLVALTDFISLRLPSPVIDGGSLLCQALIFFGFGSPQLGQVPWETVS